MSGLMLEKSQKQGHTSKSLVEHSLLYPCTSNRRTVSSLEGLPVTSSSTGTKKKKSGDSTTSYVWSSKNGISSECRIGTSSELPQLSAHCVVNMKFRDFAYHPPRWGNIVYPKSSGPEKKRAGSSDGSVPSSKSQYSNRHLTS